MSAVGVCIPTYNGESDLTRSLPALESAAAFFHRRLVIDSSSADASAVMAAAAGFDVKIIPSEEFDHGGTRQDAVTQLWDCDIIVFMTQDAVLTSQDSLMALLKPFEDPSIAISYGRQLPRLEAGPIEAHARLFSYPAKSCVKNKGSIPTLGLRSAVVSNSFAAYRREALVELGGFPRGTLFAEDTLVGAKAILAGYSIAYVAEATVFHSHGYSLIQEFRRYFDNGVFYSREKWILEMFGRAEGSGKRFILSEFRHLLRTAPLLLPFSLLSNLVKYIGYRVGTLERFIPIRWKRSLSMNRGFWTRELDVAGIREDEASKLNRERHVD